MKITKLHLKKLIIEAMADAVSSTGQMAAKTVKGDHPIWTGDALEPPWFTKIVTAIDNLYENDEILAHRISMLEKRIEALQKSDPVELQAIASERDEEI